MNRMANQQGKFFHTIKSKALISFKLIYTTYIELENA